VQIQPVPTKLYAPDQTARPFALPLRQELAFQPLQGREIQIFDPVFVNKSDKEVVDHFRFREQAFVGEVGGNGGGAARHEVINHPFSIVYILATLACLLA